MNDGSTRYAVVSPQSARTASASGFCSPSLHTAAMEVMSHTLADLTDDPSGATSLFKAHLDPEQLGGRALALVHRSCHWAFHILRTSELCVTLHSLPPDSIDRVGVRQVPELHFLTEQAPTVPKWSHATHLGLEKRAPLGYLEPHSLMQWTSRASSSSDPCRPTHSNPGRPRGRRHQRAGCLIGRS